MKRAPNQISDPANPQDAVTVALDGLQSPAWQFSAAAWDDSCDTPATGVAANLDDQIRNDNFHFVEAIDTSAVTPVAEALGLVATTTHTPDTHESVAELPADFFDVTIGGTNTDFNDASAVPGQQDSVGSHIAINFFSATSSEVDLPAFSFSFAPFASTAPANLVGGSDPSPVFSSQPVIDAIRSANLPQTQETFVGLPRDTGGAAPSVSLTRSLMLSPNDLASLANPAADSLAHSAQITESAIGAGGATGAQIQQAIDESGLSVNGSGIKVGVLSDSFNNLGGAAADEADGALPPAADIDVIKDLASGGTDEGRAMMQIIHDIAPGANLAFYTAFDSEQDFANGILALAAAGCKVICDDVSYFDEPFFQNGVVAQAIQTVEAEGVTYVTAAGNNGSAAYQAAWTHFRQAIYDGFELTHTENFGGSPVQTVTVDGEVPLLIEWNEPYGAARTKMEAVVFQNGHLVGLVDSKYEGEPDNPWLGLELSAGTYQIALERVSGPKPGLIKEIAAGDGIPVSIGGANVGTVYGHAMTPGAISAGAVSVADTPAFGVHPADSEYFSSLGTGTELLFANNGARLSSPDTLSPIAVSSVDDIRTTVPDLSDFYGTSAASASLAGVAALMLSANPDLSPAQVEQLMEQTASPMANSAVSGAGLVQVDPAVAAATATVGLDAANDAVAATGLGASASLATDAASLSASNFSLQYKGFDYVAFYNAAYENSDSLPSLAQTGANSIEATLDYGINARTSQVVADPNYTDSLSALGATIAQAEHLGLSVMVRPLIDFLNPTELAPYTVGEWRQDYHPTNVAAFFASYQQMIVSEAEVAQANGAQMLSIGAELDQLTGPQYLPYWTDIIDAVRAVFSGELTYSASWNTAGEVSFWSQLNYEGIDCYVPLSDAAHPTLRQLERGWLDPASPTHDPGAYAVIGNESPIDYFENLSAKSGKQLIFTELGYANDSGAAADPAASGDSPDPKLQAKLYKAFFDAWDQSHSSSLIGTYFWEWDPNGSSSNVGPKIDSFSPQNSPALHQATIGFEHESGTLSVHLAALQSYHLLH